MSGKTGYFGGLFLLVLCVGVCPLYGQAELPASMAFADALFGERDYYRAITEYKRIEHSTTNQASAIRARFMIGLSYFQGSKWDVSSEVFSDVLFAGPGEQMAPVAQMLIGESAYRRKDYTAAIDAFETFVQRYPADTLAMDARMRIAQSYLQLGQADYAGQQAEQLQSEHADDDRAARFAARVRGGAYERKSPLTAGLLAGALPGAGYIYTGRPRDGALAFLLNVGMFTAAAVAYYNDEPVAGTFASALGVSWYAGNIYGSVNAAHKYNRDRRNRFIDRMDFQYGVLGTLDLRLSGVGALSVTF